MKPVFEDVNILEKILKNARFNNALEKTALMEPIITGEIDRNLGLRADLSKNIRSKSLTYRQLGHIVNEFSRELLKTLPIRKIGGDFESLPKNVPYFRPISILMPNCIDFVCVFLAITSMSIQVPFNADKGLEDINFAAAPLNPKYTIREIEFYLRDCNSCALIVPPVENTNFDKVKSATYISQRRMNQLMKLCKKLSIPLLTASFSSSKSKIVLKKIFSPLNVTSIKNRDFEQLDTNMQRVPRSQRVILLLHTSGTTGRPKRVPLTHANLLNTISNVIWTFNLRGYTKSSYIGDRSLVVMPLFHVHGLIGALLSSLVCSSSAVVMPFSARLFWHIFKHYDCSWYSAVPSIHQILLSMDINETDLESIKSSRLRFIRSCSSSLPTKTFELLEQKFGVPVIESYAMTEAAHQICSNFVPERGSRKVGSVGQPVLDGQFAAKGYPNTITEVRIISAAGENVTSKVEVDGEICCKGSSIMTYGYLGNPEANSSSFISIKEEIADAKKNSQSNFTGPYSNLWFKTGDQGHITSSGHLKLTGRLKELINRGGEKISPVEIDEILLKYDNVKEAVSFGFADKDNDVMGEQVRAAVVLKNRASHFEEEEKLKHHCAKHLARFKIPSKIFIVESIPKTATGKVQRRLVANHFSTENQKKSKL